MGRPRKNPPRKPADPAHISEVRRAAALASAKVRAEKAKTRRRPKTIGIPAETFDRLEEYAHDTNQTIKQSATEAIDRGLTSLRRNKARPQKQDADSL